MTARFLFTALALLALLALAACGGGPKEPAVTIVSIDTNPGAVTGGSLVALSASISAPGQSPGSMTKTWTVDRGELFDSPPDFSYIQKGASAAGVLELATTANTVYWVAPSTGAAVLTVAVGTQTKTRNVNVTKSALSVAVTDGTEGRKIVTVSASDVTDLFQAAFRVNFSSAWRPESAVRGDFLGPEEDTLFLGLTNKSGFVPVAITRKGNAAGVDGSGTLAVITFEPSGAAASSIGFEQPFDVSQQMLVSR